MRKYILRLWFVVFWVAVALQTGTTTAHAESAEASGGNGDRPGSFNYTPPGRGAPKVRISGAARGGDESQPSLWVLAPDHVGLTTQASPTLFWYQSETTGLPIVFSLSQAGAIEPLLEFAVVGSRLHGQVGVDLTEFGVCLEPGREYRWVVAIVPDVDKRSKDVLTEGRIRRTSASAQIEKELKGADAAREASVYARHGIWYDALQILNKQIDRYPDDRRWKTRAAGLLNQVGLSEPAEYLKSSAPEKGQERKPVRQRAEKTTARPRQEARRYMPGQVGSPSRVISAGSRGGRVLAQVFAGGLLQSRSSGPLPRACRGSGSMATISVPATEGTTLTIRREPVLSWHISEHPHVPVGMCFWPCEGPGPACEVMIREPRRVGIQELDLGKFGICLDTERQYEWAVMLVPDPADRSKDLRAGTKIRRVTPGKELQEKLAAATGPDRPALLARHGFFMDALAELSDLLEQEPDDEAVRRQRGELLMELDLEEAAARSGGPTAPASP